MKEYIGIDVGGTKCAVLKGNESGISERISFATTDLDTTLNMIFDAVSRLMPAECIGVSCGGPLDERRGVIMSPPNLPGWDDVALIDMLRERFSVPAYLCNDANACALAEWRFGAGQGCDDMIFLTFGTGLGAGLILDGRLYVGKSGMAGEAGHIRLAPNGPVGYGKAGSFEGFCSGGGIAALGRSYAEDALARGESVAWCENEEEILKITTKKLAEYAKRGDPDALKIFDTSAERLGEGLSVLIDILNPERIVIGSVYARCEELFARRLNEVLRREALAQSLSVCTVLPAALGEQIGDYAALTVAIEGERLWRK
ncbi:MAG: ROK family protein [Clostridia bacterium]|nr:ROK family protein [Clostridia bacterium]